MTAITASPLAATRTPRLEIFPDIIAENAAAVIGLCHRHGAQVAAVTKVFCAHPAVTRAMVAGGADMLADSRLSNLWRLREHGFAGPLMLLRLPAPSEAADVVRVADVSLNSSSETLRALSAAAVLHHTRHQVVVMVDVGDLREGVWPDRLVDLLRQTRELPALDVVGLGCNLACFGGVVPTPDNMQTLIDLRATCRAETGLELSVLSGGNSSGLPLLASGKMPREINHVRVGEAIVLGRNVIDRSPFPGTRQDTFVGVAEVIEVAVKPSVPIGERGQDAFGNVPAFVDRGNRRRAICNLGRQDVVIDNIVPVDPGIEVLGGSSDHLILDVENATCEIGVGSEFRFYPGYGALLALATSPYVHKLVLRGN